jgi:hypothetical protein
MSKAEKAGISLENIIHRFALEFDKESLKKYQELDQEFREVSKGIRLLQKAQLDITPDIAHLIPTPMEQVFRDLTGKNENLQLVFFWQDISQPGGLIREDTHRYINCVVKKGDDNLGSVFILDKGLGAIDVRFTHNGLLSPQNVPVYWQVTPRENSFLIRPEENDLNQQKQNLDIASEMIVLLGHENAIRVQI